MWDINRLLKEIRRLASPQPVHIAGGPVRDLIIGRKIRDIDLVLPEDAISIARRIADEKGGAFVMLAEEEGVARVVLDDLIVDFSQYRNGSASIEEDLMQRDFTINAMAMKPDDFLKVLKAGHSRHEGDGGNPIDLSSITSNLIDPCQGLEDLRAGLIRTIARSNLASDPLRLLRAFRFEAELGFMIESETLEYIHDLSPLIKQVAPERTGHELNLLMASHRAGDVLKHMNSTGLLAAILPETRTMKGIKQPGFHHLDVLEHCLETVCTMDRLLEDPCKKFKMCSPLIAWLKENSQRAPGLKWAALLHDFGKPLTRGEKAGRTTFYNHDRLGADLAANIARRLRWARKDTSFVIKLIKMHMRPFHLLNDLRRGGPTRHAMRRLLNDTGPDYPALFLLAMADSMAGCGPLKPANLDEQLANLWEKVHMFHERLLKPVRKRPRLLTGHDVIMLLNLEPGPLIGKILDRLEEAQIEGAIKDRIQAMAWVKTNFSDNGNIS